MLGINNECYLFIINFCQGRGSHKRHMPVQGASPQKYTTHNIGETATLPFVKDSEFGIFLDQDILVLTDCICGGKQMCKAEI